jgi:choline dehydrogenase-like flavoprotein
MIGSGLQGLSEPAADVCVVGSGPAGIALAIELSARGKRVLVLESGGETHDAALQELSASVIADPRVHDDTRITMSRRLGGTSNLWGARCQPFDAIDFEPRPWVPGAEWPIALDDITPWYARACELVDCGAPVFRDRGMGGVAPADTRVELTRLERFSNRPRLQQLHRERLRNDARIDLRLHCTVVDADFGGNGRITQLLACTPDGMRRAVPVQQVVLAMGGLETTRLMLNLQQRQPKLFGGPQGALGRHYMAHVVGEVADVDWHTEAMDRAFDFFVDSHGSYARRRLIPSDAQQREHRLPNVSFWPVVPPVADAGHRSALLSSVFVAMSIEPVGRLLVAEAIRRYHAPEGTARGPHLRNIALGLPSAIDGSARFLWQRYMSHWRMPGFFIRNPSRTYGLSYHAEHFPSAESRVRLSDERDRHGLARLHVDLRFGAQDAQALFRAHELMRDWLAATGLGHLRYRQPAQQTEQAILDIARHGTHQIGTVRMASSAAQGVVDSDLRCFDVPNLHVASSAVFPSSGQANPTLTLVALAVRLGATLASDSAASMP